VPSQHLTWGYDFDIKCQLMVHPSSVTLLRWQRPNPLLASGTLRRDIPDNIDQRKHQAIATTGIFPPEKGTWPRAEADAIGMDGTGLAEAVAFAEAQECDWPRSMYTESGQFVGTAYVQEGPPHNEILGAVQPRGATNGLVLRRGYLAAEWGDVRQPDMTFSAAKSYLAILAGLAFDDGLLPDIDAPVADMPAIAAGLGHLFDDPLNRRISWRHLLDQTSEWKGTLWSKPDSVDSNRQTQAGANVDNSLKGTWRARREPGTYWEYNDVRVNLLALCLLHVFRRPLPEVLKHRIMDPIGASGTWRWMAYRNAVVAIDGTLMASVPGGGHWGGGIIINSLDHARVGHLVLNNGTWNGYSLLSKAWIDALRSPCSLNPNYSLLWWLNSNGKQCGRAPQTCFFAAGGGGHIVWIDPENELVIVTRWVDKEKIGDIVGAFTAAVKSSSCAGSPE